MRDAFKAISWLVLIAGSIAVVVSTLIFGKTSAAIAEAVVAVAVWMAWAYFLSWLFGIRRRIVRHMGAALGSVTFLAKSIPLSRTTDLRRSLERLLADKTIANQGRHGVAIGHYGFSLTKLLANDSELAPLQWSSVETLAGKYENFPKNAVYLLHFEQQPFVVYFGGVNSTEYVDRFVTKRDQNDSTLEIIAGSLEEASRIVEFLLRMASIHSIYRGMMLHLAAARSGVESLSIEIAPRPAVDEFRIVLPQQVLEVLQRTISARLEHHELLQRLGHSSKTGILLHGPPGTGKTLVVKHLIGICRDHTAIVALGMEAETIREAFRFAAYLQPSLVVIEDVDLLAERRETNANVTGLQELMNEMDGLASTCEAIVLMTTNRPEVLEPALAARPGRVSQAIEFPLPNAELRRRLITVFCSEAGIGGLSLDRWVERTHRASPAFLEELVKRAILFAVERNSPNANEGQVELTDADFDQAIHELVVFGGKLTANVLGFRAAENVNDL